MKWGDSMSKKMICDILLVVLSALFITVQVIAEQDYIPIFDGKIE